MLRVLNPTVTSMAGTIRIEDPDDNIPLFGPDPPVPALVESDDEENVYAHIDARAIDVELDMPSANPNIMNVTSHRQDKSANLSC